jgi:CSLREA domain-containing protein
MCLFLTTATPVFAAVRTVTKTADTNDGACDADCSLREAINAVVSGDEIAFAIDAETDAGCVAETGVCTIEPGSALPDLSQGNVFLNGFSQTGATANTKDFPNALNSALKIVIDGTSAGAANGIYLSSSDNKVQGLVIKDFATNGIYIFNGSNNYIQGCFIGVDVTGEAGHGNGSYGIKTAGTSQGNMLGADGDGTEDAAERNLISSNVNSGINLNGVGLNTVAGNFIGTNKTGLVDLGNTTQGIYILSGSNANVIGTNGDGTYDIGEGNLISGSTTTGVVIASHNNTVAGNYIGVDATGNVAMKNDMGGITITGNQNTIGTNGDASSDLVERNIISGNSGSSQRGVFGGLTSTGGIIAGNYIGVGMDGTTDLGQDRGIQLAATTSNWVIGTNGDGNNDAIEGNVISGNLYNLYLEGTGHSVAGNIIGPTASGTVAMDSAYGVDLFGGSQYRIGTNADGVSDEEERNIISGNSSFGVIVEGGTHDVTIAGNYIGTNITGTAAIPNFRGVNLGRWDGSTTCSAVLIGTNGDGDNDAVEGNVISGNTTGIAISGGSANTIAGNMIGVAADGLSDLGNAADGIAFIYNGGSNNLIGGDVASEANIIAYNGDAAGEYGVKIAKAASDGNKVLRNSIYENQNEGIFLAGDGANNDILSPEIEDQAAEGEDLIVSGTAAADETIQLFVADDDDEEGKTYLHEAQANGSGEWSLTVPAHKTAGTKYVATTTDDSDGTSEFSLSFTVLNVAPDSSAQIVSTTEDTAKEITLTAVDANDDSLTYTILTQPSHGSLSSLNQETGSIVFAPTSNYTGSDSFTFKVNDGTVDSDTSTVLLSVIAENDTPQTENLSITTTQNSGVKITLQASDVDSSSLTYSITKQPAHGAISSLSSSKGTLTYTPTNDYVGSDSFKFKVSDGTATSNTGTVSITVTSNNSANTKNETPTVSAGTDRHAIAGNRIYLNATAHDADGDVLTYQWSQSSGGVVTLYQADTSQVYFTPDTQLIDSILEVTITVSDGIAAVSDTIHVFVSDNEINTDDVILLDSKVVALDSSDNMVTERIVTYLGGVVQQISFWNNCALYTSTDASVLFLNLDSNRMVVADPYSNNEQGKVVLLNKKTLNCLEPIDMADDDIVERKGVLVTTGSQAGSLYGANVQLGDLDGDNTIEIYVSAPGTGYGYVYGLNSTTLNVERLFIGAQNKRLTSALMVFGDFNNSRGSESIFGFSDSLSANSDTVSFALSGGLMGLSYAETFGGFSADHNFTDVVNLSARNSDYLVASPVSISHLSQADINADDIDDVFFGSQEDCSLFIQYGNNSFGQADSDADSQVSITCSEDTDFSTLVTHADVSGDGVNDLIVGFPDADNGAGRILVLFGPLDSSMQTYSLDTALVIKGADNEGLGQTMVLGDYDLDGIDDIYAVVSQDSQEKTKVILLASVLNITDANGHAIGGNQGNSGGGCVLTQSSNLLKNKMYDNYLVALNLLFILLLNICHRRRMTRQLMTSKVQQRKR